MFSAALTGHGKHVRCTRPQASAYGPNGSWQIAIGSSKERNIQNDEGPRRKSGALLFVRLAWSSVPWGMRNCFSDANARE